MLDQFYTQSLFLPFLRRRFKTCLPCADIILRRKPCVRLPLILLGVLRCFFIQNLSFCLAIITQKKSPSRAFSHFSKHNDNFIRHKTNCAQLINSINKNLFSGLAFLTTSVIMKARYLLGVISLL